MPQAAFDRSVGEEGGPVRTIVCQLLSIYVIVLIAVGVEALQTQLRQATERAAHAEQPATETSASDEALSRTLLLAQRTADTAVEEAREQASRVVAAAESQARIIVEEATERSRR